MLSKYNKYNTIEEIIIIIIIVARTKMFFFTCEYVLL